jgi:hypothetical protein
MALQLSAAQHIFCIRGDYELEEREGKYSNLVIPIPGQLAQALAPPICPLQPAQFLFGKQLHLPIQHKEDGRIRNKAQTLVSLYDQTLRFLIARHIQKPIQTQPLRAPRHSCVTRKQPARI